MTGLGTDFPEGFTKDQWRELLMIWLNPVAYNEVGPVRTRKMLASLTKECPLGGNPKGCCIHEIRKLDQQDRIRWVLELNDHQVETIYQNHLNCSRCPNQ